MRTGMSTAASRSRLCPDHRELAGGCVSCGPRCGLTYEAGPIGLGAITEDAVVQHLARGDQAPEQLARGCSRSAAKAGRHVRVEIDGVSVTGTPVIAEEVV